MPTLVRKLGRLRDETAPQVSPVLGEAAQKIVDMMKRQVPVDQGDLRDNINWTFGDAPKGTMRLATAKRRGGQAVVTIYAGNDKKKGQGGVYWARWVEFGTAKMAGRPYFFPSYRAMRKEAKRMIRAAISQAVRNAIK